MHVELEYARMTKSFAKMKEELGDLSAASEVMQDVNVETLSTMGHEEKFEFLLEQFRLVLAVGDRVRAELTNSKFNVGWLDKKHCANAPTLKRRYFELLIEYRLRAEDYLAVCSAFLSLLQLEEDELSPLALSHLRKAALYAAAAPDLKAGRDMRASLLAAHRKAFGEKQMECFRGLLMLLTADRVIDWGLGEEMERGLLADGEPRIGGDEKDSRGWRAGETKETCRDFDEEEKTEAGEEETCCKGGYLRLLRRSVVMHNAEVLSKHYERLTIAKAAGFMKLSPKKCEEVVCEMVTQGQLMARIDHPNGVVDFVAAKVAEQRMDEWGQAISETLSKLERVCNLIEKENVFFGRQIK